MTEEKAQASAPLHDRAQVRVFTLADYVADEPSGKLYISGAGLEWTGVPVRPDPDGGLLFSCYIVLRLAFPKGIARDSHLIKIRALQEDGSPAGPDPLLKFEMLFDPESAPTDFAELSGNLPVHIVDYPLVSESNDIIYLDLIVDEILVSRLPVELVELES